MSSERPRPVAAPPPLAAAPSGPLAAAPSGPLAAAPSRPLAAAPSRPLSAALFKPPSGASIPTRIGHRYHVLERLGYGGTAVVYRVRDSNTRQELALKQLVPHGSAHDLHASALFEREFYVLAQLSHPSLIEVYDFGIDAAGPYYTMELLEGGDLGEKAPLPVRTACELMMQVCSSLSLLHSRRLLHRDISPRNVRCTRDGKAKLIDFGALALMGTRVPSTGTPAFVAPEVLHRTPLDARTDLFSVGATLYYALTGQRPFAALSLRDAEQAWLKEPVAPSQLVTEVPAALDSLVLSLLRIDPARRPRSAFEVMQRLAAIAGVAHAEPQDIWRAYLASPTLIGREAEQRRFRQRMRGTLRGRGGALLFDGPAGLGRSRLLDTCVLEAKTVGAAALYVHGRAATTAAFATGRGLGQQLLETMPDLAVRCAAEVGVTGVLFSSVDPASNAAGVAPRLRPLEQLADDRPLVQSALAAWLRRVAGEQPLILAVDDVERIDEASLALLAALAHTSSDTRLLIVTTAESPLDPNTVAPPAFEVLRNHSIAMTLAPLTPEQTGALFTSVFFDAPHVALVSDRVYKVAAGNPRDSMALAQHMLDKRLIRYADGNWILPAELSVGDLPASTEESLRMRLASLPDLPRRLIETQALALAAPWTRSDYLQLVGSSEEQQARVDEALTTLLGQGVLVSDGNMFTLSHLGVRAWLVSSLTELERTERHLALAELCVRSGRPALVEVHHSMLAGCDERALDRLAQLLRTAASSVSIQRSAGVDWQTVAAILERACNLARASGRPAREIHELSRCLLELSIRTDNALYYRHAAAWFAQLEQDSGLADYAATQLEQSAQHRLTRALTDAQARYAATPERDRVYRIDEAWKHLAHYVSVSTVIGIRAADTRLLAALPQKLEPFAELSPALYAMWQSAIAATEIYCEARLERARSRFLDVNERLAAVTSAEVPYIEAIRHGLARAAATLDVSLGYTSAERWIQIMEQDPLQRVGALSLRRVLCIFDGDREGAERFRKESELAAAQASVRAMYDVAPPIELAAQVHAGDLAGVKQVGDRIAQLAAEAPGWLALHHVAQGSFHRLRGDLSAAKAEFERALVLNHPDREDAPPMLVWWVLAATGCVKVLTELGELNEARALGLRVYERCQALSIGGTFLLVRELAIAEAKLGDCQNAAARLDAVIEARADKRPSFLAEDYEARARVAIWAKDAGAAAHFARLAGRLYGAERGAKSIAKRESLLDEARRAGLALDLPLSEPEAATIRSRQPSALHARQAQIAAELAPLPDASARALRSLVLLCGSCGGRAGQLYYARDGGLALVAQLGKTPDPTLDRFVHGYWRQQLERAGMTTVVTEMESGALERAHATFMGPGGMTYRIALLETENDDACVGLVALRFEDELRLGSEYASTSAAISMHLLEVGDAKSARVG